MSAVPPKQEATVNFDAANINNVRYYVNGTEVTPTDVHDNGGGNYDAVIKADDVKCPGPIEIKESGTVIKKVEIAPCP